MMFTLALRLPLIVPLKGCWIVVGGAVPGGWIKWTSVAVILSPFLAAGIPMAESQLMFTRCPLIVMVAPAFRFRVVCASTFVSAVLLTSTFFAWRLILPCGASMTTSWLDLIEIVLLSVSNVTLFSPLLSII